MCLRKLMCWKEDKEVGRQPAPGACPYCGGKVEAVDVEVGVFCCVLPLCFTFNRKFLCTLCSRRLLLYPS
nr:uncharacterized protein LOC103940260 [Ipomoea batatas]